MYRGGWGARGGEGEKWPHAGAGVKTNARLQGSERAHVPLGVHTFGTGSWERRGGGVTKASLQGAPVRVGGATMCVYLVCVLCLFCGDFVCILCVFHTFLCAWTHKQH